MNMIAQSGHVPTGFLLLSATAATATYGHQLPQPGFLLARPGAPNSLPLEKEFL
jgi:hypothetical protein